MQKCRTLAGYCSERKEQVMKFIDFLEKNTAWLTAPASTRYHLNEKHGLLKHSVGVVETLLKLREILAPQISKESCVIAGLFHDLGKIGTFEKPNYLENDNEWEIKKLDKKYKNNPDLVYMGIAQRSLWLVSQHIRLTDEEAQAILYHDGQYIDSNKEVAHKECLLTLLLTFADTWHTAAVEEGRG